MIIFISSVVLVLILDLWSKAYMSGFFSSIPESSVVVIKNIISFRYTINTGAAFGIFAGSRWMLLTITALTLIVLTIWYIKNQNKNLLFNISCGLILAGGLGNMYDRVFLGYVRDFIEFTFVQFAIFNVADSAVTIGTILLVLYIFLDKPKVKSDHLVEN